MTPVAGFVLTIADPAWLLHLTMPVMIGAPRLRRRNRQTLPHPVTVPAVVIDSGAFTELHRRGRWTIRPDQYAAELVTWSAGLPIAWAAPLDWPCEAGALAATGRTVAYHQAATVASVLELRDLGAEVVPVLQGWTPAEYVAAVDAYTAAGVDLTTEPVVAIGSTCRRADVGAHLRAVAATGVRPHAFGLKTTQWHRHRHLLGSADSMAWSATARRHNIRLDGCTHTDCRNCRRWAATWWATHR